MKMRWIRINFHRGSSIPSRCETSSQALLLSDIAGEFEDAVVRVGRELEGPINEPAAALTSVVVNGRLWLARGTRMCPAPA